VAHIAEHDTEEEWECYACIHGWVDFLVAWYTVSVDYLLEDCSELVRSEVCWGLELVVGDLFEVKTVLARRVLGLVVDEALFWTVEALEEEWLVKRRPEVSVGNCPLSLQLVKLSIDKLLLLNELLVVAEE